MSIGRFLKRLGAKKTNHVWSWGAIDEVRKRAYLQVWDHEFRNLNGRQYVEVFWTGSELAKNGERERSRHLDLIRDGYHGYGLSCKALIKPGENWQIRSFDKKHLLVLGETKTDSGKIFMEVLRSVSVSDLSPTSKEKDSEDWTNDELRDAISAYLDMQARERNGRKVTKKAIYRSLSEKHGRTTKSFEFRMQNISYVLSTLGRPWISGLKPAKHVGPNVADKIERILCDIESRAPTSTAKYEATVSHARKKRPRVPPIGNRRPRLIPAHATSYERDAKVAAYVLDRAKGLCEGCGTPAPFVGSDGEPFLEVHHVKQLAIGGSDTIGNAAALCPNCHRELHYGRDANQKVLALYLRHPGILILE